MYAAELALSAKLFRLSPQDDRGLSQPVVNDLHFPERKTAAIARPQRLKKRLFGREPGRVILRLAVFWLAIPDLPGGEISLLEPLGPVYSFGNAGNLDRVNSNA